MVYKRECPRRAQATDGIERAVDSFREILDVPPPIFKT